MNRFTRSIGTMVAALAWIGALPACAATLTIGSASGAPGSQVSIPVSYDGTAFASRIEFTVSLNVSRPGGVPPLVADPVPKPGTAPIVDLNDYDVLTATCLAQTPKGALPAGDLMTIALTIPASVPEGTTYILTVSNVTGAGIRATVIQGVGGTVVVKGPAVRPAVLSSLAVLPGAATLTIGGSQMFQASGADAAGKPFAIEATANDPITWQVDHPDLAQIDSSGLLTALQPGMVTVTATFEKVSGTALVTIGGPAGKAPDDVVSIGSATAKPGDQVDLPLTLTGTTSLADLELSLDLTNASAPALKLAGIKAASGIGAMVLPSPANPNLQLIALVAGDTAIAPGTAAMPGTEAMPGAAATLTFSVSTDAKGSYNLNPVVIRAHDTIGDEFVFPSKAGILTVGVPPPPVTKGDANGDGVIDIRDATATLRVAVGLDQPTSEQKAAMDVNGDGTIDVRDVVRILEFVVGLIKSL